MKILIIGGTGTMGKPLVQSCLTQGYCVSVVCRRLVTEIPNVKYYYGDAKNDTFISDILIEHFDCIIDFCLYSSQEFICKYQKYLKSTDQYICLSSVQVCADTEGLKTEESPRWMEIDPPESYNKDDKYNWYCYEKARIEDTLKLSNYKNWTIIRPSITMNENHYLWNDYIDEDWTYRIIRGQSIVVPKNMLNIKTSITCGSDVAQMLMAIIGNKSSLSEIYNVTTKIYTWGELLEKYKKIFKKYGYEIKIKYIESHEPLVRNSYHKCTYERTRIIDRSFDSSKVYELMDQNNIERKFAVLDEEIEAWIKKDLQNIPNKIEKQVDSIARLDRISHEWTPLNRFSSKKLIVDYIAYRIPFLCVLYMLIMKVMRIIRKML